MDDATTWALIHRERSAMADTLTTLEPAQWARPSLCGGWSVQEVAGHLVAGAEQTKGGEPGGVDCRRPVEGLHEGPVGHQKGMSRRRLVRAGECMIFLHRRRLVMRWHNCGSH